MVGPRGRISNFSAYARRVSVNKDEASDLSPKEKKALKTVIEGELAARAARRSRPRRSRRIC